MGHGKSPEKPKTYPNKTISLAYRGLANIPGNIADIYPNLENLDLLGNELTETAIEPLLRLINKLPSLKKIILSLNPIRPEILANFLHVVRQTNDGRQLDNQLVIISDFCASQTSESDEVFHQRLDLWLLEPAQWKRIAEPYVLINRISNIIQEHPEKLTTYKNALIQIFNEKCANGWTLFSCCAISASTSLIQAAIDVLGPEGFYNAVISLFTEQEIPGFDPEIFAEPYISYGLLYYANDPALARKLSDRLLTENSKAHHLTLGLSYHHEKNFDEAMRHYSQGIELGCMSCSYLLTTIVLNEEGYENTSYSFEKIVSFLNYASLDRRITPEYDLALLYEQVNNMSEAYKCYKRLQQKINDNPSLAQVTPCNKYFEIESRLHFGHAIDGFFSAILHARTTLYLKTFAPGLRKEGSAFWQSVQEELAQKLTTPALLPLIDAVGKSLLTSFLDDKRVFDALTISITQKIENKDEQHKGLRAHTAEVFSSALIHVVREFQTNSLGAKMKTGYTTKIPSSI